MQVTHVFMGQRGEGGYDVNLEWDIQFTMGVN